MNPAPRITPRERAGLAAGYTAGQGAHNAVHVLSHQVLNVSLGMNPMGISGLLFLQRMWSAALDPIFGQWSDNLRTRFGRRRPLLFLGAFPLALGFAAFWWLPHGLGRGGTWVWLVAMSLILYAGLSLHAAAFGALQIEVTAEYHQRTRLAAFLQFCFLAAAIGNQWLYLLVQGRPDPIASVRHLGLVFGAGLLGAALLPVWLVREPRYADVARTQRRIALREGIRAAFRNGAFVRLLCASGAANFGYYLASFLGLYLNYYYIYRGDLGPAARMQSVLGTAFQLAAVAAVFVFRRAALRWGKRRAFVAAGALQAASAASRLVLYTPAHPSWQIFAYASNGAAFAGISLLAMAMVADVTDLDEWRTGRRSEGVYSAVLGWADKVGGAFGILLGGFVFPAIGFEPGQGHPQSAATLHGMLLLYALFPFVGGLAAIALIRPYRLSERAVMAMRSAMRKRRPRRFFPVRGEAAAIDGVVALRPIQAAPSDPASCERSR